MAAQDARLRPFTFYARLPKGVTNVDLTKILVQRFSKQELGGVQDFGAGRFEIFFKTKPAVERFLASPVVTVREQEIRFEYRGSQAKVVRVLHYPNDQQDEALCRALGVFGQVHSCSKESVAGFPGVWSGVRRLRVDMNRAVPNLVPVGRFNVQCEYEGVVRLCIRCGFPGHYAAACTTPKCRRCELFGHEQCEDPCSKCGGDHAVSACTFRSFAMVAQAPPRPAGQTGGPVVSEVETGSNPSTSAGKGSLNTEGDGDSAEPLREALVETSVAPNLEESAPDAAAVAEEPIEETENLSEGIPLPKEAPKPARARKRPRQKGKARNPAANVNAASDDEASRTSREAPAEKRPAVEEPEVSGCEDSDSSGDEMTTDSSSSDSEESMQEAFQDPLSPDTSTQESIEIRLPRD